MAAGDDELEQLRRADPLARNPLPSPDDPAPRALFERITMDRTQSPTRLLDHPPSSSAVPAPWYRRPVAIAVAAAVIVVVLVSGAVAVSQLGGDSEPVAGPDPSERPVVPGPSSGSCVETYDLETLADREVVFDGTVESVDGDRVTFSVNEAFRGVSSDRVTLAGAGVLGGVTSAGASVPLEPGTRLLVAGDGGFAWSCGFTQPYDAEVAEDWARSVPHL